VNSSSIHSRVRSALLIALICGLCAGCYLMQSVHGQLSLMSKREPISRVVDDPSTPPALRAKLQEVTEIRDFASRELGLPDNGSYRSYADVGRPFVVWNVVAAPEFSLKPKRWCYPVVGCVAYRGYFKQRNAQAYAAKMRAQGLDVSVGGVAAYSTLGHFSDPILNTMVEWDDIELASIVFHELTHQMLYVRNDTSFNEALATTVQEEGVRRWLLSQGRDQDLAKHMAQHARYLRVIDLLIYTQGELRAVYASGAAPPLMREQKSAAFAAMKVSFAHLKEEWGGHAPFESWFNSDINNAHLASVATYYSCVPGFERELAAVGGDLNAFYQRARALAKLDQKQRDALVCGPDQRAEALTGGAAPSSISSRVKR
jgi:predicted aminopeptidase